MLRHYFAGLLFVLYRGSTEAVNNTPTNNRLYQLESLNDEGLFRNEEYAKISRRIVGEL